jgi:hypothetical protein
MERMDWASLAVSPSVPGGEASRGDNTRPGRPQAVSRVLSSFAPALRLRGLGEAESVSDPKLRMEREKTLKKQKREKKGLKLHKETVRLLSQPELKEVAAGLYSDSCFPDICQERESSAC